METKSCSRCKEIKSVTKFQNALTFCNSCLSANNKMNKKGHYYCSCCSKFYDQKFFLYNNRKFKFCNMCIKIFIENHTNGILNPYKIKTKKCKQCLKVKLEFEFNKTTENNYDKLCISCNKSNQNINIASNDENLLLDLDEDVNQIKTILEQIIKKNVSLFKSTIGQIQLNEINSLRDRITILEEENSTLSEKTRKISKLLGDLNDK